MHKTIILSLILFTVVVSGQTAWKSSGISDNTDVFYKSVVFEGILNGVDTLYSDPFSLQNTDKIFTCWFYTEQENDSVKIIAEREALAFEGGWVKIKTMFNDSTATYGYVMDTLNVIPLNNRIRFRSVYGNGKNTLFRCAITAVKK